MISIALWHSLDKEQRKNWTWGCRIEGWWEKRGFPSDPPAQAGPGVQGEYTQGAD